MPDVAIIGLLLHVKKHLAGVDVSLPAVRNREGRCILQDPSNAGIELCCGASLGISTVQSLGDPSEGFQVAPEHGEVIGPRLFDLPCGKLDDDSLVSWENVAPLAEIAG